MHNQDYEYANVSTCFSFCGHHCMPFMFLPIVSVPGLHTQLLSLAGPGLTVDAYLTV